MNANSLESSNLLGLELTASCPKCCPNCESTNIQTEIITDSFEYGSGKDLATLIAKIPVETCHECGFSTIGESAMALRHEAICRHLNRLTPSEIKAIRDQTSDSQVAFAELSGLGVASLIRWESGHSLQSKSNDRLLRLISYQDNVRRLEDLDVNIGKQTKGLSCLKPTFQVLDSKTVEQKRPVSQIFQLRRAA